MKKSDLYREWGRVLDMCEGTNVDPRSCWEYGGIVSETHTPAFCEYPLEKYRFAVAILEDKPVFVGDTFYEGGGNKCTIKDDMYLYVNEHCLVQHVDNVAWHKFSWNPPKKTFMLNGWSVPCPLKTDGKTENGKILVIGNECFCFDGQEAYDNARYAICMILRENAK